MSPSPSRRRFNHTCGALSFLLLLQRIRAVPHVGLKQETDYKKDVLFQLYEQLIHMLRDRTGPKDPPQTVELP